MNGLSDELAEWRKLLKQLEAANEKCETKLASIENATRGKPTLTLIQGGRDAS